MGDDDRRLDGNAAAGPLSEIFALETTAALVTCAGCGTRGALGAAPLYASGPGTVVRCPGCSGVLLRYARVREQLLLDVSGIGLLAAPAG
jgi:Family of unknown function (DUF6510)